MIDGTSAFWYEMFIDQMDPMVKQWLVQVNNEWQQAYFIDLDLISHMSLTHNQLNIKMLHSETVTVHGYKLNPHKKALPIASE